MAAGLDQYLLFLPLMNYDTMYGVSLCDFQSEPEDTALR